MELFDYGFNNFRKLKISDHEKKYTISNPGFMRIGKDIYGNSSIPFTLSGKGYVCIPNEVSFDTLDSEVVNSEVAEEVVQKAGERSSSGDRETDDRKGVGGIHEK